MSMNEKVEKNNLDEHRTAFDLALENHEWDDAVHLISEVQEAGFPRAALGMTERWDLERALEAQQEQEMKDDWDTGVEMRQMQGGIKAIV